MLDEEIVRISLGWYAQSEVMDFIGVESAGDGLFHYPVVPESLLTQIIWTYSW